MPIDYRINQIRVEQIIAQSTVIPGPGRIFIFSDKTAGTQTFNGNLEDITFIRKIVADDIFVAVSGSRFNVGAPNTYDTNSGVVLFTGDVVMSGSLVVSTEQKTNYTPIEAVSSSFFNISDLDLGSNNGRNILNSSFHAGQYLGLNGDINLVNASSVIGCSITNAYAATLASGYAVTINNTTGAFVANSTLATIGDCLGIIAIGAYNSVFTGSATVGSYSDLNFNVNGGINGSTFGNYIGTVSNSSGFGMFNNVGCNITNAPSTAEGNNIIIGSYLSVINQAAMSFLANTRNSQMYANHSVIIGGNNNEIDPGGDNCMILMGDSSVLDAPNQIVLGTDAHTTYISGSAYINNLKANSISGSLTSLLDGSKAFTTFHTQSGPTHINTQSNGQIMFGTFTRLLMGNYLSSTATSSIPAVAGATYINTYEHEDIIGQSASGSYAKFRCILSTADIATTASVKLWDVYDSSYIPIGGAGIYELTTSLTTPTVLTSVSLSDYSVGFTMSDRLYETHIYISGSGSPAIVNHHISELLFAPRTLTGYS